MATSISNQPVTKLDLDGQVEWKKVASGKVREIFEVDEQALLFVATDRISAYDYIMENVSRHLLNPKPWRIASP